MQESIGVVGRVNAGCETVSVSWLQRLRVAVVPLSAALFVGCGSVGTTHQLKMLSSADPSWSGKLSGIEVVDESNSIKDHGIPADERLNAALETHLSIAPGEASSSTPQMRFSVLDYQPGNAFFRWLLGGIVPKASFVTALGVHAEITDGTEQVAEWTGWRGVRPGGFFGSPGGWKRVFNTVANDIADDIKKEVENRSPAAPIRLSAEELEALPVKPVSDKILVYVVRPMKFVGAAVSTEIYVDGTDREDLLARLRGRCYAHFFVTPGQHTLYLRQTGSPPAPYRFTARLEEPVCFFNATPNFGAPPKRLAAKEGAAALAKSGGAVRALRTEF